MYSHNTPLQICANPNSDNERGDGDTRAPIVRDQGHPAAPDAQIGIVMDQMEVCAVHFPIGEIATGKQLDTSKNAV